NEPEVVKRKSRNYSNVLIGVVAIIVGILLLALLQNNSKLTGDAEVINDNNVNEIVTEIEEEKEPQFNFEYLLPTNWDLTSKAEDGIAAISKGQKIQFGIVQDPADKDFVYFAASVYDSRKKENLLSIYKFNSANLHFERLYRSTYGKGDFSHLHDEAIPIFHVIGYADGRLVILAQDMDDSPGPCAEPMLFDNEGGARALISMNLMDPYAGFNQYTPPEELIDELIEEQRQCLDDIFEE
ncbi:MAG: hypothetical protein ABH846_03795, partial [Patescibacteria group bacterium]